jgi:hypothetical protein
MDLLGGLLIFDSKLNPRLLQSQGTSHHGNVERQSERRMEDHQAPPDYLMQRDYKHVNA